MTAGAASGSAKALRHWRKANDGSKDREPGDDLPGALEALAKLRASVSDAGIPETTRYLIEVRASQINGCGVCLDMHTRELQHTGEPNAKILTVAVWREAPYFTDAERAALTEATTRLAGRADPVPDEVWEEAARHYTGPQLAALVISIATINTWNRLQAVTRQICGEWVQQVIQTNHQAA